MTISSLRLSRRNVLRRYASLAVLLIVLGCGSMSIDMKTTVQDIENFSHEMTVTATGELREGFTEDLATEDLRAEGWEVSIVDDGDATTVKMSRDFVGDFGSLASASELFENLKIEAEETDEGIEYRASFSLADPEGDDLISQDDLTGMDELMLQSFADTFTLKWTVEIPGEIIDTNAETQEGNVVTWDLDLLDLVEAPNLYVVSLERKSSGLFGLCG